MKEVNLLSLTQAYNNLNPILFESFLRYNSIEAKNDEISDLASLVMKMNVTSSEVKIYNGYFVGYSIPQISKEFDILRFGENYNINIELKRESTPEKIKKQLTRNQYYLEFLGQETYSFTYVTKEQELYTLDEDDSLKKITFKYFIEILNSQKVESITDINKLFNPKNYLVSPLNSTEEFIDGKYFLTAQQEEIKKFTAEKILNSKPSIISICGKAGTGKTLLTYDIAKEHLSKKENILIFHCGNLNDGHQILTDKYGWKIEPIKYCMNYELKNYHLIIVDEAQRIYPGQLNFIINEVNKHNGKCIFSYDSQQWLRKWELTNNIESLITKEQFSFKYELTEKIRTNKEIASFTKCLFSKRYNIPKIERSNIDLAYFDNYEESKNYIEFLRDSDWKVINYTPSRVDTHPYENFALPSEQNAHGVVGQEFDKVVAVIDSYFFYNGNDLSTRKYKVKPYYHPTKMLFQIITRTQNKLHVIIINNKEVLERCLNILNEN